MTRLRLAHLAGYSYPEAEAPSRAETQGATALPPSIATKEAVRSSDNRDESTGLSVRKFTRAVVQLLQELKGRHYLQELLGYDCVDSGFIAGAAGDNIGLYFFANCGLAECWPDASAIGNYSLSEVNTFLEFIAPRVSAGIEQTGRYHSYNDCGWHFDDFDHRPAFRYVQTTTNQLFKACKLQYAMNEIGRILPNESVDKDPMALLSGFYDTYVARTRKGIFTREAATETAEDSEWAQNPKDSFALLKLRGWSGAFDDRRRTMLPGTLTVQRKAAAIVEADLDPDVIPF
jgi:hypothetical protein